ncbi:hypothetical protein ABRY23_09605 [Melioribacteraceae bacterium 4301-Me]|uniref:hypothetical protein n=1 Tax=Pyranulibacter aquaticus TaxID=3163344 RepID=UPI00359835CF
MFSKYIYSQNVTLDWKLHNIGKIRLVVTNTGEFNAVGDGLFNYPGLINCEYPPNSSEEHIADAGLWVGATLDSVNYVSVAEGEGSPKEFYPSDAMWDTIWVVSKNDTVDIPYWNKYVGKSDQDFVCRYTDYGPVSLRVPNHHPLGLEVIQISHAWASEPLSDFIVVEYFIISRKYNLKHVFLTSWMNGNVGNNTYTDYALDDITYFQKNEMMQICLDLPGGVDGQAISPIGNKIFPPNNNLEGDLSTTFTWYNGRQQGLPSLDNQRYSQISSGKIMEDQISTGDGTKGFVSVGPYKMNVGDTLHFTIAFICGKGIEGLQANAKFVQWLVERNFKIPSPPPPPPLRIKTDDKKVILDWKPRPGDINPEEFIDVNRTDGITKPFEGYRVYKSTISSSGPWTLLGEYDIADDNVGPNTGLAYQYTDVGLLNNVEYYYTVTSLSKPDATINFPEQESSLSANAKTAVPGTSPPNDVGAVAVVPNPYRGDLPYYSYNPPWEKPTGSRHQWMEQDRRIQFINLPVNCEIKIYTLAGDLITTLQHNDIQKGYEDWNLTSSVGQAISSGLYLFTVEDKTTGNVQVGKFVIIK